jgi:proton glutamate symport protein
VGSSRSTRRGIRSIELPVWILIGAGAGLIAGVVLGERTVILKPLGSAYAMMLQVAAIPIFYVRCFGVWAGCK